MKRFLALFCALTMCALLFAGCNATPAASNSTSSAVADNSLQKIKDKGVLVLGLDDNFPPMGFRDANNNIVGFDIDVAKEVAKIMGVELKLQPIDWDAKEQELNTGNIDCIWNGFSISEERQKNMTFTEPYMDNHMALVVRNDSGFSASADLKGKSLGLQGGSSASDALDANADFKSSLGNVVQYKDNLTALMDLDIKGVDAVLMDDTMANYYITSNNKAFKILSGTLSTEQYAVGLRKGDMKLKESIEGAFKTLKGSGKLAEISKKWFGKDLTIIP